MFRRRKIPNRNAQKVLGGHFFYSKSHYDENNVILGCGVILVWNLGVVNLPVKNFEAGRLGAGTVNTGIYIALFEKGYRCCRCVLCDQPHTKIRGNAIPNPLDWCLSPNFGFPPQYWLQVYAYARRIYTQDRRRATMHALCRRPLQCMGILNKFLHTCIVVLQGCHLGEGMGHFPTEVIWENEKLYYASILSDTTN